MAKTSPKPGSDLIYQLKVTLRRVSPPIWRRLLVPANFSLAKLHRVLQVAMGWEDDHLYEFVVDRDKRHGVPDEENRWYGLKTLDESRARLGQVAPQEKSRFLYLYDFGDKWEHDILVEKTLPREEGTTYPTCITGLRSCPPEDCGGAWGHAGLLEALGDPDHVNHAMYAEWFGGELDPEAFDRGGVNRVLARIR